MPKVDCFETSPFKKNFLAFFVYYGIKMNQKRHDYYIPAPSCCIFTNLNHPNIVPYQPFCFSRHLLTSLEYKGGRASYHPLPQEGECGKGEEPEEPEHQFFFTVSPFADNYCSFLFLFVFSYRPTLVRSKGNKLI